MTTHSMMRSAFNDIAARRALAVVALLGLAATGCDPADFPGGGSLTIGWTQDGDSVGTDSSSEETDTAETDSAETDTEGTDTCGEAIPAGWSGPIRRELGSECPDGRDPLMQTFAGLEVEPSTCSCACGPIEGGTCVGEQTFLLNESTSSCDDIYSGSLGVPVGETAWTDYNWLTPLFATAPLEGGACAPSTTASHPAPAWAQETASCAVDAAVGAACEPTCIFQEGDQVCPAGFPERVVEYEGFEDSRACEDTCACGSPDGDCDLINRLLEFLPYEVFIEVGECAGMSAEVQVLGQPNGSCEPSADMPATGSVEPALPVTFCCEAPPT